VSLLNEYMWPKSIVAMSPSSSTMRSGSAVLMPFGRPVVPEE
jgi:hypothetical protein